MKRGALDATNPDGPDALRSSIESPPDGFVAGIPADLDVVVLAGGSNHPRQRVVDDLPGQEQFAAERSDDLAP